MSLFVNTGGRSGPGPPRLPYYPPPQPYRPQRKPGRCQAEGTVCNNKCVVDYVDGQLQTSNFCDWHYCHMVEGGRMCCNAKKPRGGRYCEKHLQCKGMDLGVQCTNMVREGDPLKWSFCVELHLCTAGDCHNERCRHPDTSLRCCHDLCHGCHARWCCERRCEAQVQPSGRGGRVTAGGRFVTQDCAHPGCDRPKEEGTRFCREHRCAAEDCGKERDVGQYCAEHTCQSPRCQSLKAGVKYCVYHLCSVAGCEEEATGETDDVCRTHGLCREPGCSGRRFVLNGTTQDQCERHYHGVCSVSGRGFGACGAPIEPGTSFCIRHLCVIRTCTNARVSGYDLCRKCKCEASACRRRRIPDRGEREGHRGVTFCEDHECKEAGCAKKREGGGGYCYEHVRTPRENGTSSSSEQAYVLQEARKRQEKSEEEARRARALLNQYERDLARQRAPDDSLGRDSLPPRTGSPWNS